MVEPAAEQRSPVSASPRGGWLFLIAATASFYGDWLTTVGLVVLLYQMTGTTSAPAGYILVRLAPRLLGAGPAGSLVDRFGPTRVIAAAWTVQGAFTLAIIPLAQARSLIGIYGAVAAAQFLNAMARPSMSAAIPRVVPPQRLRRFNGMFAAADSTSVFVAPAIGSALLSVGGVRLVLLLDAASFVFGAALLASLRVPALPLGAGKARQLEAAGDGVRLVWRDRLLRTIAASFMAGAVAVAATQSVLVVAAAERFGGDSAVGWLYSAVGAGALAASLFLIKRPPRRISRASIAAVAVAEVVPLGALAYVWSTPIALLLLASSAGAGVLSETWGSIDLQERVPPHLLGRVNAAIFAALYLGMMLGAGSGVVLAPLLHWDRALLVVAAVGIGLLLLAALIPGARQPESPLKDFPE